MVSGDPIGEVVTCRSHYETQNRRDALGVRRLVSIASTSRYAVDRWGSDGQVGDFEEGSPAVQGFTVGSSTSQAERKLPTGGVGGLFPGGGVRGAVPLLERTQRVSRRPAGLVLDRPFRTNSVLPPLSTASRQALEPPHLFLPTRLRRV